MRNSCVCQTVFSFENSFPAVYNLVSRSATVRVLCKFCLNVCVCLPCCTFKSNFFIWKSFLSHFLLFGNENWVCRQSNIFESNHENSSRFGKENKESKLICWICFVMQTTAALVNHCLLLFIIRLCKNQLLFQKLIDSFAKLFYSTENRLNFDQSQHWWPLWVISFLNNFNRLLIIFQIFLQM